MDYCVNLIIRTASTGEFNGDRGFLSGEKENRIGCNGNIWLEWICHRSPVIALCNKNGKRLTNFTIGDQEVDLLLKVNDPTCWRAMTWLSRSNLKKISGLKWDLKILLPNPTPKQAGKLISNPRLNSQNIQADQTVTDLYYQETGTIANYVCEIRRKKSSWLLGIMVPEAIWGCQSTILNWMEISNYGPFLGRYEGLCWQADFFVKRKMEKQDCHYFYWTLQEGLEMHPAVIERACWNWIPETEFCYIVSCNPGYQTKG